MARRPGRPKAGTEVLSRERIVAAAFALVDADGVEALSMRRLAAVLGVDPMAIYRHLPDKAAVIAGMVEAVFGEFAVPPVEGDWRARVRAFAVAYRESVLMHPNLIVYLITDIEASLPAIFVAGEYLAAALCEAGLTPIQVVIASNLIIDYLNGYALSESSGRLGQPGQFTEFYALLDTLPAKSYPTMQAVYKALDETTLHAHAHAELELILTGIEAWVRDAPPA